ncbi:hypothetical protein Prudu_013543 [Prunus dulcis]|uniref:Uncharacterized protein n=1 Tax=Prunus dulcis TaxID=3755 RepID=A0A4Y1RFC7_PRUDU|nr:hypothetical protein Prudu_013543 [Prunus dulcis]
MGQFSRNPEKRKEFPRKMSSDTQTHRDWSSPPPNPSSHFSPQPPQTHLSQELQQIASNLSSKPMFRTSLSELSGSRPMPPPGPNWSNSSQDRVRAHQPQTREKSEELKARLQKLAEILERNAYAELVKDITPKKETNEPFILQGSIGFGYAAFRALFNHSPVMNAAGGILGLVVSMLVETLIFIIRSSGQDLRSSSSTPKLKKNHLRLAMAVPVNGVFNKELKQISKGKTGADSLECGGKWSLQPELQVPTL